MKRLINLASLFTRPKPPVGTTPSDVVYRENKWRLLRYRPRPEGPSEATPVLLVPSLINRHYVMDLLPGKSMAEDLVKAGHDVYCLDWGTPGDEDRYLTFDDVCDRYLGRAIRHVAKTSPRNKTHVLGYCLGGTLAVAHTAAHAEHVASLLLLAAPVAFADDGMLTKWTQSPSFDVGQIVRACGNVPWQLMQGAFHMLRPTLTLAKTVGLVERAANDEFLDGFLALETWGNDNVSFPGKCYEEYIERLYRNNELVRGTLTLSGKPARLESIGCPTMAVVFEHDNIVPWESAAVLVDRIAATDKALLKLPGGHVGAVVSKAAQKKLWPQMSAFWKARDRDAAVAAVHATAARADAARATNSAPANGASDDTRANGAHEPERSVANGAQTNGVHANGHKTNGVADGNGVHKANGVLGGARADGHKTNGVHEANGVHVNGVHVNGVAARKPAKARVRKAPARAGAKGKAKSSKASSTTE